MLGLKLYSYTFIFNLFKALNKKMFKYFVRIHTDFKIKLVESLVKASLKSQSK